MIYITSSLFSRGINLFQPRKIFILLASFLFLFPKGGFKIGAVPLTWGYLLLGIIALGVLMNAPIRYTPSRIPLLIALLPFQIASIFSISLNGSKELPHLASFFTNFFLIPWIFLLILSDSIEKLDRDLIDRFLRRGILFLSCYGIALFFIKLGTDTLIQIPLITTNLHDFKEIEEKCNQRGTLFKLISTYNNGNLFGICLLMFYPLYQAIEPKRWKNLILKTALILTLSRTIWLGLIFSELLIQLRKKSIIWVFVSLSCFLGGIFLLAQSSNLPFAFFFDFSLGGRIDQFAVLDRVSVFGSTPFYGISEIVYLGILREFGLMGLFTYLIAMVSPILTAIPQFFPLISPYRRAVLLGLLNYLFISGADGAILRIPVMALYWFLSSLLLKKSL
jgi:hypothetical protein